MEVNYQAKLQATHLEIVNYFRRKNRVDGLDCLQFNDELTVNQEIELGIAHCIAFELQCHWFLAFEWNVPQCEFYCQCLFINRFQESWAKNSMHLNRCANHLMR